jgi:hypothetical protein
MKQGELMLAWYVSGFHDRRVIDDGNFRWYGGLFNVVVQLVHRCSGVPLYEASHVCALLVGIFGLVLVYGIGASLASRCAGFLSALFLWLTPVYYGHSFNNPKDLPFAVLMLAAFAIMLGHWQYLPRLPAWLSVGTGIVFGMGLGIRMGALVNFLYLGLVWLAWLWSQPARPPNVAAQFAQAGGTIAAVAWGVMLLCWPYAMVNPVLHPWRAMLVSAHFSDWIHPVRFNGADILSNALPWTYAPIWLAMTLPEFYLIAAIVGVFQIPQLVKGTERRDLTLSALIAIMILMPLTVVIAAHSILYNGIRHLLFLVPLLAMAAGISVATFLARARPAWSVIVGGLLVSSLACTTADMVRLHPYQSVYFNRLIAGGLPRAADRFETDYWGQSYREGVEWLTDHYGKGASEPIRVANCSTSFLTGTYLPPSSGSPESPRFVSVEPDDQPHVVLATTRWFCYDRTRSRVLHVVRRMGVPLTYVAEVRMPRSMPSVREHE